MSGNSSALIVPIRVEAVIVEYEKMVCSPLADFSKLPWSDGNRDYNFETPFLGDSIVHKPFEDRNFRLRKGLHLHFILPHFLGTTVAANTGAPGDELPAAPNRWVIKRTGGDLGTAYWLVQSDYIHENPNPEPDGVSLVPFLPTVKCPIDPRPYRFMGWQSAGSPQLKDLKFPSHASCFRDLMGKDLTVLGYGDHNFSSFYPNCSSVFGFYDESTTKADPSLTYELFGWNDRDADDILVGFLRANRDVDLSLLKTQLQQYFGVDLDFHSDGTAPYASLATIYHAEIRMDGAQPPLDLQKVTLALGRTGTEAISARLATDSPDKAMVEEQLTSIDFFSKLGPMLGDIGPKFQELRHTAGFRSVSAGSKWVIGHQQDGNAGPAGSTNASQPQPVQNVQLALALDELNKAQHDYDEGHATLASLQEQLYLDWCKYMQASYPFGDQVGDYPAADEIRSFIESHSLPEVHARQKSTGQVDIVKQTNKPDLVQIIDGEDDSLARILLAKWTAVASGLGAQETLSSIPADRYWQAKPPVLLVYGMPNDDTDGDLLRKAGTNHLKAYQIPTDASVPSSMVDRSSPDSIDALSIPVGNLPLEPGLFSQSVPNPFILEWMVKLRDTDFKSVGSDLADDAITQCMIVEETGADFEKIKAAYAEGNPSYFAGSVIMSQGSRKAMLHKIVAFLEATADLSGLSKEEIKGLLDDLDVEVAKKKAESLLKTFQASHVPQTPGSIYGVAITAVQDLLENNLLSQQLTGFNHGALMRRITAQLPVDDPMGFADNREFTHRVRRAIGIAIRTSPIPGNDFNPILSGALTLEELNLLDNFGRVTTLSVLPSVQLSETLKDVSGGSFLHPRIVQPARVNFDWLSAEDNPADGHATDPVTPTNSHPETTPVCGWLMPNYFNNDILVFDTNGFALGSLDEDAIWSLPPDAAYACEIDANIGNEHLRRVVKWLQGNPGLLADFLDSIEVAQDHVSPGHAHHYDSKALLMGRPIAVVRASVNLQLMGLPALDQSWRALQEDMGAFKSGKITRMRDRSRKSWEKVRFPFRLGEHFQLDDGLLGYWKEGYVAHEIQLNELFAPESDNQVIDRQEISCYTGNGDKRQETMAMGETDTYTLLMDPRSGVHLTSGILPTVKISILPSHFLPALRKMEAWFRVFPLVQPTNSLAGNARLNAPKVDGCEWQWYDRFQHTRSVEADPCDSLALEESTLTESFFILKAKTL
jgi:hypothetical protein